MIGITTKKIIVVPCMVNIRLKTCGDTKSLCGYISWMRMIDRLQSRDHEEAERVEDVEDAQPLVIDGGDPVVQRVDPGPRSRSAACPEGSWHPMSSLVSRSVA